jgi:GTPase SAR1 family protein
LFGNGLFHPNCHGEFLGRLLKLKFQVALKQAAACSRSRTLLVLTTRWLFYLNHQGPAGSGKSTYCHAMQQHAQTLGGPRRRNIHVANLDPAAEHFGYELAFDIRDLISVEEVMEELGLGPNGGLIYCMEYLLNNLDWLQDQLDTFGDDEYLILDCPGQLELYTHVPLMRNVVDRMRMWGYEAKMVAVFLIDVTFVVDISKFLSGSLLSLSAMIALELPHVNVLTKCDLIAEEEVERILSMQSASELWTREQDSTSLLPTRYEDGTEEQRKLERRRRHRQRLTDSICQVLDDYTMVSYVPLNIKDEDSVDHVLACVDSTIQWGEDQEVKGLDDDGDYGGDDE